VERDILLNLTTLISLRASPVKQTFSASLSVSRHLKAHLRSYSAPAWWGFSTSADRQRIETFLRRAARSGLWASATTAEELIEDADERLFSKVRYCAHHVLGELLPSTSDSHYNLRKRRHVQPLPQKKGHLAAKNFIFIDYCTKTSTDLHSGFLVT